MMFKRSKGSGPNSTPSTPKISSIALPTFGGESNVTTKATPPKLPPSSTVNNQTATAATRGGSTTRMKETYPLPAESSGGGKTSRMRSNSSTTGAFSRPPATTWDAFTATQKASDNPRRSDDPPVATRGGPSTTAGKKSFFAHFQSSTASDDECYTQKQRTTRDSSSTKPKVIATGTIKVNTARVSMHDPYSTDGGGPSTAKPNVNVSRVPMKQDTHGTPGSGSSRCSSTKLKPLKPVNVTRTPMKQEPPLTVHWQLINFHQRRVAQFPPLRFDLASDFGDEKNMCFLDTYPHRRMTDKDLVKPATDVKSMAVACDDLPKWADWYVYVHAPKDDPSASSVRCIDVFKAIHETYNKRMTEGEIARLSSKEKAQCEKWFSKRCGQNAGLEEYNRKKGMRRVDLLQGQTFFDGLRFDEKRSLWVMHLAWSVTK